MSFNLSGSLGNSQSRATKQAYHLNEQVAVKKETKKQTFFAELFKPSLIDIQDATKIEKRTIHFIA